jgi:hypothetical protein
MYALMSGFLILAGCLISAYLTDRVLRALTQPDRCRQKRGSRLAELEAKSRRMEAEALLTTESRIDELDRWITETDRILNPGSSGPYYKLQTLPRLSKHEKRDRYRKVYQ